MMDAYFHEFTGTGHETGGDTRYKPNPGWHYYEHSQSVAHAIETLFGIDTGDPLNPKERKAAETMLAHERQLFPGTFGGSTTIEQLPQPYDPNADPWGLL